jgi:hypothetical protein
MQTAEPPTSLPERHLVRLQSAVRAYVTTLAFAEPAFSLKIRWSHSYDELFRDKGENADESTVLAHAFDAGRVLLVGRGGAGKSQMLLRILKSAARDGYIVVHVRLQDWTAADDDEWDAATRSNLADGGGFLIERFGKPETSAVILDWLPPTARKLLLVDGLNELASTRGLQILRALDELTRNQVSMAAIVTDRLARRELPVPVRWDLGLVLPLSSEQIQAVRSEVLDVGPSAQLLSSPYFLDAALKGDGIASGVVKTQERYFATHVNLTGSELKSVAAASFDAYRTSKARGFLLSRYRDLAGSIATNKLLDAGALLPSTDDSAHFAHHLLHDFLAARHVASLDPTEWTSDVFEAITLQASSFDSVAMVFEQLTGETADRLLESLYDWNLYAAGYALAEAINGLVAPSQEMQVLIYAMLAEKQFDPILASRQRATDSLLLVKSKVATAMAEAGRFEQVCEVVNEVASTSNWFQAWRTLFTDVSKRNLSPRDIEILCSENSVMGWTMANVARRLDMTVGARRDLVARLTTSGAPVRWRIAHVLGAHPGTANSKVLLDLLDGDASDLVRYGALRSLVELAARTGDPRLRSSVARAIMRRVPAIERAPRLKAELCRALVVDPLLAPREWRQIVMNVAREFYRRTEDPATRDQWRAYATESIGRYSLSSTASTNIWFDTDLIVSGHEMPESAVNAQDVARHARYLRDCYAAIRNGANKLEPAFGHFTRFGREPIVWPFVALSSTVRSKGRLTKAKLLKTIESMLQTENRKLLLQSR